MTKTKRVALGTYGKAVALVAIIGLSACALPEGVGPQDVARFETAVASVGCQLVSEAEYLPVELQTGLTREQTTELASYMLATDRAVRIETGGIKMVTGPCA